jgi:hypothetical protein
VTVAEYVAGLPEDRRATVAKLRALLNRRMPKKPARKRKS